jgi:DNA polymerase III epsilon subunit-like protein
MQVADTTITVIDFETTGVVEGFVEEAWQIGMVRLRHGGVLIEEQFGDLLHVDPRRPFNVHAPGRHAQLRDQLATAPALARLWPQLQPWLVGRPLAAHQAGTERRILENAFPLHPFGPWIDTLKLARLAYPDWDSHRLEDLILRLQLQPAVDRVCPDGQYHEALYDAVAAAVLLEHLLRLPGWQNLSVAALAAAKPTRFHRLRARRGPPKRSP